MAKDLNIYWSKSNVAPYDVHAPAQILSTFNFAVRGQLLSLKDDLSLGIGHIEKFHYDYNEHVYLLKLKEGLKFHNGREATSEDLEFSILRGFYTPDKSFFKTYFGDIQGVNDVKPGEKFKSGRISGVKILDKYSLQVVLTSANPAFFHSLTTPYFSLIPIEALKEDYLTWRDVPIGVGQFRVLQKFDGKKTILENIKNKQKVIIHNFYDDKIVYDVSYDEDIIKNQKASYSDTPIGIRMMAISLENELSKDINFRKGLKYLINRNSFESEELGISPLSELLPSPFWGRLKNEQEFDVEKAKFYFSKIPKKLLEKTYEIPIFTGASLTAKHLFYEKELIKQFKEVGLKIKFVPNSEKFTSLKTAQSSPLNCFMMIADYIDPLVTFSAFRKNGHETYYRVPKYIENQYEDLYESAIHSKTFPERLEYVKKLSKLSQEEQITLVLAEEKKVLYYNPKTIKSLGDQPQPLTLNIENIIPTEEGR